MSNDKNPDFGLLKVFIAVYEHGGVVSAADALSLTQPAVSNAMTRLSARLGRPLFIRSGRGSEATETARSLYREVKSPYLTIESALKNLGRFQPESSERQFKVALSSYFDMFFPELASVLQEVAPGVSIERVTYHPQQNIKDLKLGVLDMLVGTHKSADPGVKSQLLATDRMVLVARAGHPLLNGTATPDMDLMKTLRFASVSHNLEKALPVYLTLQQHGIRAKLRTDSLSNLLEVVAYSDHVALLPRLLVQYRKKLPTKQFSIPFATHTVPLELVWLDHNDNDPGNGWLRTLLTSVVHRNTGYSSTL